MTTQYERFFYWLGQLASGDIKNPSRITPGRQYLKIEDPKSRTGRIGKYQMTERLLASLGYFITAEGDDGLLNKWKGTWTGKRNVHSIDGFLSNEAAQEYIIRETMRRAWRLIRKNHLDELVGTKIGYLLLTESSLLALMHFRGEEEVLSFAPQSKSANNIGLGDLMRVAGFQTPYDVNPFRDYYQEQFRQYLSKGAAISLNSDLQDIPREQVETYTWCTQGDNKVRASHASNEGMTFEIGDSPEPGEEVNCRCFREDSLSDSFGVHKSHKAALEDAVRYLNDKAKNISKGACAQFVRDALNSAGQLGVQPIASPHYAKDYGYSLTSAGFTPVITTTKGTNYPPENYIPQTGDVVIIQDCINHIAGHMAMYNGTSWVSDYIQPTFWPEQSTYANEKPSYTIYRLY